MASASCDLDNFLKNTTEQHTARDLVNLLYFLRPVSSDHSDFIREFEQDT